MELIRWQLIAAYQLDLYVLHRVIRKSLGKLFCQCFFYVFRTDWLSWISMIAFIQLTNTWTHLLTVSDWAEALHSWNRVKEALRGWLLTLKRSIDLQPTPLISVSRCLPSMQLAKWWLLRIFVYTVHISTRWLYICVWSTPSKHRVDVFCERETYI